MTNPDNLPLVSLDTMNTVHFEEAALVNTLLQQLESDAGFEAVSAGFEALLVHMQQHFESEEKLMQVARYPSFRMHKAEHDKVLNGTRNAEMEWRNRKEPAVLREYLEDNIVAWLDQHIKAMDTPMADFVLQSEMSRRY